MADNYIRVQPDSTGKAVDTAELTDGGTTVEREIIVIGDPTTAAHIVTVGSDGSLKVDNSSHVQSVAFQSYSMLNISASGNTSHVASYILGFKNNSFNTQTVSFIIYDNPSGASGPVIEMINVGLSPTQGNYYPAPGLPLGSGGFTIVASGVPVANGIHILYV